MEAQPPPLPSPRPDFSNPRPAGPGRGWLLIVLGTFLSAGMAFLVHWLHQALLHNDDPGAHGRWTGGAEFTRNVFGLFWSVFVFGLVSMASGVYILRTRRLSRVLWGVMLAVIAVMVYFGYTIMQTPVPAR